jgi:mono/diheme cytochrome c family protein
MKRLLVTLIGVFVLALGSLSAVGSASSDKAAPTFTKDVAPIVFQNCASCHRPGEIGPMSFMSYKEVRPWAKSIREKVLDRTMPPWGADPKHGDFANSRALSQQQIETLVAWVDAGAKEGDAKDLPPTPQFPAGWQIGTPDATFTIPDEFSIPADGVLPYQNFALKTNFTEDMYVQQAEIRPSNRGVVHHAVLYVQDQSGRWLDHMIVGYAPGKVPGRYRPGKAKLVPKGAVLILNMHYTPNGTAGKDRTSVGFIFAKTPVEKTVITAISGTNKIDIAPGDANYELKSSFPFKEDSHIEAVNPHMHARGKDFLYTLVYPDGTSKVLLQVPRYNFNWQMHYVFKEPVAAPKGSRLECVAHYDNSTKNAFNPDPTARVRYGEQTWDEMMAGYLEYTLDSQNLQETAKAQAPTPSSK